MSRPSKLWIRAAGAFVSSLIVWASPLWAAAGGSPAPMDVSDFGLYRYQGDGWDWGSEPLGTAFARAAEDGEGRFIVVFSLQEADLEPLVSTGVRFGIASGECAGGSILWLSEDEPYACPADGPPDGPVFAGAPLLGAALRRAGGVLRMRMTFAWAPSLGSAWDLMGLVDADGDATTGYGGAEWLIQDVTLGAQAATGLSIAWLEARPGVTRVGEPVEVVARVSNESASELRDVRAALAIPADATADGALTSQPFALLPGQVRGLSWTIRTGSTGPQALRLSATVGGRAVVRARWIASVARRDPRREYQTLSGDWRLYPSRPTLQERNAAELGDIEPRPSSELRSNLFGITTHLERSVNDEDPFAAQHAVDGDPATCWGSRWWRVGVPLEPEWLKVDLGRTFRVSEVRFLPAWANSGAPSTFTIETSVNGSTWREAARRERYELQEQPEGSPLRVRDRGWQRFTFAPREARYVRLVASRLTRGATSFFCAPVEPYQFRVAEVVAVTRDGSLAQPVAAEGSSTHSAWFNTPETVTATWPALARSGVKLNRIGQWGDRTDWAAVEAEKGVYRIAPEVDRAIDESLAAGVETVLTLCYGNNLYQQVRNAPDFGPTWHRGHPFLQCGPTTPEALGGFAGYCGFMARHFRGRVRYFEIWNEENGWFVDDWQRVAHVSQAQAYGRALRAGAEAVKEANPDAIVLFGGVAGASLDYLRTALGEGAGPLIDVYAFHPYGRSTPESAPDNFLTRNGDAFEWLPRPESIRTYEEEIAAYRAVLREYGAGTSVWADEMNWFAPGEPPQPEQADLSELAQAKHLSRFFTLNAWLGCGAVWWSMYNANGIQEWAVLRSSDQSPRASYYAAQYAATVLDDVRAADGVEVTVVGDASEDLVVKAFRNGRGETLVGLWRATLASDSCRPEPVTVRVSGARSERVELLDLVYGTKQRARATIDGDAVTVPGVLVGAWPVVVGQR